LNNIYDIAILGGGASALMCSANLSKKKSIAIVESNKELAKKLKISGGGKCNITNTEVSANNYDGNNEFISHIFKNFSKHSLLRFLDRNKIELELRKNRYYFCKYSSDDIIDALIKNSKGVDFLLGYEVLDISKIDDIFILKTSNGTIKAKSLVVATGGKSFKRLGASDIGLKIAKKFDIGVREFEAALVGLTLQKSQFWMKELSGLSCYVNIKVQDKEIYEEMLFAHKGISGPAILSTSLYWKKGDISIDFLPNQNILELSASSKKYISSTIKLPSRLSKALLFELGVEDKECKKLTKADKENLKKIHAYKFAPSGNFGFEKAEVSRGGVLVDELHNTTMESKKVKSLYFIGEVVDVTGELGGYNFQWVFSSAYVCAKALKN
jgi:predicted Rossmann fold flavoprotein